MNWEILKKRTSLITYRLRNTGKRTSLITCDPWRAGGRAGGRVGWLKSIGKESILGICILKNWILYIYLNPDFLIFLQKKRAPKNDEIWRRFRGEISHMGSIQGGKLKLLNRPDMVKRYQKKTVGGNDFLRLLWKWIYFLEVCSEKLPYVRMLPQGLLFLTN